MSTIQKSLTMDPRPLRTFAAAMHDRLAARLAEPEGTPHDGLLSRDALVALWIKIGQR